MNNLKFSSELVRAFQYVDNKYLDIVEQEKKRQEKDEQGKAEQEKIEQGKAEQEKAEQGKVKQGKAARSKRRMWNHRAVIAACILCLILILALPAAAIAANWFGLRDLLLPSRSGESTGTGGNKTQTETDIKTETDTKTETEIKTETGQALPEQKDNVSETGNRGVISLAGYQGSPEWQALAEWKEFLEGYDGDDEMHQATGNRLDASFARYSCYMVHSREMADKMDELAGKYDLKLHTASYDLEKYPELLEPSGSFLGQGHGYDGYMYEDGTFQMEGSMELVTSMWDFQLLRSVKGTFHDSMLDIGNVADYKEWRYEAACGVTVTLALGREKALILADLEDCFVTVSVYSIFVPMPAGADEGVTREDLEALADGLDLAALSPVTVPEYVREAESAGRIPETVDVGPAGRIPETGDVGPAGRIPETGDVESAGRFPETGDDESAGRVPETGDIESAGRVPGEGVAGPAGSIPGAEEAESAGNIPAAVKDRNARKLYAATLRNLLYSRILPNGTHQDLPLSGSSKFSVYDVDGDGREELVLCYDSGYMAGMWGYVIGYDEGSGELHIQMEGQFDLAFLGNGNLKELDSHNQTSGEMWPYSLYAYLPESDSYEMVGHVHAEDKAISGERYPEEVDVSGTGTVYYVDSDGWGTVPIDEAEYLAWLAVNQGDSEGLEIPYLAITEENILTMEQ